MHHCIHHINASTIKKLEAFELWVYRRMLEINWSDTTYNEVMTRTGRGRELLRDIKLRKFQYFTWVTIISGSK